MARLAQVKRSLNEGRDKRDCPKRGGGWVGQEQYVGRYRYAVHRVYLCIVHRYTYTYTAILRQSL